MASLAQRWAGMITATGATAPTSDDLDTLMSDFASGLSAALSSQGANTLSKALTTPAVTISDSAMTTVLTSASVPVGTYLALATVNALLASTSTYVETQIIEGTATATVVGGNARYAPSAARADNAQITSIGIVTVTVAGTILLQAQAGTAAATAEYEGSIVTGGVTNLILVPLFS